MSKASQKVDNQDSVTLWQFTIDQHQKGILDHCKPSDASKSKFIREIVVPAYLRSVGCSSELIEKFLV